MNHQVTEKQFILNEQVKDVIGDALLDLENGMHTLIDKYPNKCKGNPNKVAAYFMRDWFRSILAICDGPPK